METASGININQPLSSTRKLIAVLDTSAKIALNLMLTDILVVGPAIQQNHILTLLTLFSIWKVRQDRLLLKPRLKSSRFRMAFENVWSRHENEDILVSASSRSRFRDESFSDSIINQSYQWRDSILANSWYLNWLLVYY